MSTPSRPPATTQAPWEEVRAHLVTVVRRRLPDPSDVDDVVHDVLVRLLGSGWRTDDVESVPAWLTRVAANAVVDHQRAARRVRPVGVAAADGPAEGAPSAEPDRALVTLAHGLAGMVDALPAPYAEAVRLVNLEGAGHAQVAARLGLSVSGVKSRVQRGRRLLAASVRDCCRVQLDARGAVVHWERRRPATTCCG